MQTLDLSTGVIYADSDVISLVYIQTYQTSGYAT